MKLAESHSKLYESLLTLIHVHFNTKNEITKEQWTSAKNNLEKSAQIEMKNVRSKIKGKRWNYQTK